MPSSGHVALQQRALVRQGSGTQISPWDSPARRLFCRRQPRSNTGVWCDGQPHRTLAGLSCARSSSPLRHSICSLHRRRSAHFSVRRTLQDLERTGFDDLVWTQPDVSRRRSGKSVGGIWPSHARPVGAAKRCEPEVRFWEVRRVSLEDSSRSPAPRSLP